VACSAVLIILTAAAVALSHNNWPRFKKRADPCYQPAELHESLYRLLGTVSATMAELQIEHWLHYGSLIGALRYAAILPWDDDIDLAIVLGPSRTVARHRVELLAQRLQQQGIRQEYSHWGGYYIYTWATPTTAAAQAARLDAMVYQREGYWMNRVGWERYLLWLNYRYWHRFPATLVEASPLPLHRFGPLELPVPQGGHRMLAYLFPENWWQEQKPESCRSHLVVKFSSHDAN
jgi:hypothetical protein